MSVNLYDFDKTIYSGDSTADFFLFCLRRYPRIVLTIPQFFISCLRYLGGGRSKERMKESFYRFLLYVPDVPGMVRLFWERNEGKIQPWYLNQKKRTDIIISASPRFLLGPVCDRLSVTLIASEVDAQTGRYSGKNCFGEEKARRLLAMNAELQVESFYSDSKSDLPLAKLAEKAFIVRKGCIYKWERSLAAKEPQKPLRGINT